MKNVTGIDETLKDILALSTEPTEGQMSIDDLQAGLVSDEVSDELKTSPIGDEDTKWNRR